MKRHRSKRWTLQLVGALWASVMAAPSHAQGSTEGATFLLRPLGARAVGLGQAVVSRHDGSESVWWNPAGLAVTTKREVAIHHSQDFFATGDAISVVLPSSLLGVVAVSADIEDFGEQENTTVPGFPPNGTILPRSIVLSTAYATTVGAQFRTGISFKVIQLRFDCTGPCDLPTSVAQSYALDAGVQYDLRRPFRLSLGASVRNVGLPLQVEDSPQADQLPSRVQIGATYDVPLPVQYRESADLGVSLDVVGGLRMQSPLPRLGADFTWEKRAHVRAGFVMQSAGSRAGGPSLGLGFTSRSFTVDLSRVFTGFSADAGQAPTYLSLRIEF